LAFHGKASEFAQQHGVYQFYISISHERQFAVAFVVLLSDVSQQLIDCLRIRGIER